MSDVIYKIRVNRPCRLFIDDEEIMLLDESKLTKINLCEGEYLRKVVAIDNSEIYDEKVITLSGTSKLEDFYLDTTGLTEAKYNALYNNEVQIGDLFYKISTNGTGVAVAKCANQELKEIAIPSQISFGHYLYDVVEVGEEAFEGCSSITSIILPCKVINIEAYAFKDCSSLVSIILPNSVANVVSSAFYGTGIYNNAFNWIDGVLYISDCLICAKKDKSGIYKVIEGTRLIAATAFCDCSLLTMISIPNSVTNIGFSAFNGCSSLTAVSISTSITDIKASTFYGCSSLTSVSIPNSVETIECYAFAFCTSLASIYIPNSVTSIEDLAFSDCLSLNIIYCYAIIPPTIESFTFVDLIGDETRYGATICVPFDALADYKAHNYWKKFTNIQGIQK